MHNVSPYYAEMQHDQDDDDHDDGDELKRNMQGL